MRRRPVEVRVVAADLQMDEVSLASVVPRHRGERFPIDTFLINAEPAPARLVLKHLVSELVDA